MANPWWACYGQKYKAKTGHLTMLQHGAYFILLNNYYITGGPLPEKTEHLIRLCGAHSTEEIEAISFVLSSFFSLKSDGWHNKKADEEIREAKRISNVRRLARLGKRKTIVNQELPVSALHPHPHPHIQKEKSKPSVALSAPDGRHAPVRKAIHIGHLERYKVKCQWDGSEAKALERLLTANPSWSEAQIVAMVANRFASDCAPDRPRQWLPNLGSYAAGPLDRFGQTKGIYGTGGQNHKTSRAREVAGNNYAAAAAVGWTASNYGTNEVQGIDHGRTEPLEGEIKRLSE